MELDLKRLDWVLIGATLTILVLGLLLVASATGAVPGKAGTWGQAERQAVFAFAGLVLGAVLVRVDPRRWAIWWRPLYLFNVFLLVAVKVVGVSARGAERWIALGPLSFQPAELSKLLVIVTLAALLSEDRSGTVERGPRVRSWREIGVPALALAVPILLILAQPDLGTSLVFVAIGLAILYTAGFSGWLLGGGSLAALLAAAGVVALQLREHLDFPLKQYQLERLIVFLNPVAYAATGGYQILQSQMAVGSGALFGYGLFTPTSALNVPESHTDFIFSVAASQLGLVGSLALLALYGLLLWRGWKISAEAQEPLYQMLAAGITAMIAVQVVVNIGMVIGIMPVTGIPLPMVSVGGSSLVVNLVCVGLLESIAVHRKKLAF
ncbi:MAG: rod shape-determining protein RodA [Bacillota bacterium]|nr:rod shape-determining protein RodA [Bacillota bacterium]